MFSNYKISLNIYYSVDLSENWAMTVWLLLILSGLVVFLVAFYYKNLCQAFPLHLIRKGYSLSLRTLLYPRPKKVSPPHSWATFDRDWAIADILVYRWLYVLYREVIGIFSLQMIDTSLLTGLLRCSFLSLRFFTIWLTSWVTRLWCKIAIGLSGYI